MRASPDDFRVDERLAVELSGAGEHLWLRLEKRSMNTTDVVALLERAYGIGSADIGVSGLKDRRAVTRQWFSVRTPADAGPLESAIGAPGRGGDDAAGDGTAGEARLVLIGAGRHARKLRRGTHVANAFEITLRDVRGADGDGTVHDDVLAGRVRRLRESGFPNYLGPQRFGRDGSNLVRARAWFRAPRRRASRWQRSLWLSAARSLLFNRVCAARVEDGSWSSPLDGEPLVLDGTRSFFVPDGNGGDAGVEDGFAGAPDPRLAAGDVHPSGPWWGRGESPARGACATFEAAVLEELADFREGLERAGLSQERRALRAFPQELALQRLGPATLRLTFALPPGVFATTLLGELGTFDTARGQEPAPATGKPVTKENR